MKNTLVFGVGRVYDEYYNLLKYHEMLGNINICAVTSSVNKYGYCVVDNIVYVESSKLEENKYDLVLIAAKLSTRAYKDIYSKCIELGFGPSNIFPIDILKIPNLDFDKYVQVSDISIFAQNCWGGYTYHSLELPFRSPFINLLMPEESYIKFAENYNYYLGKEVEFSHWMDCAGKPIPVGKIDDIFIRFLHYNTFEEAVEKWNERKKRINYDNLFFMMFTDSPDVAKRFCKIKGKKVCFTSFECEEFEEIFYCPSIEKGIPLWDYVNKCADGRIKDYNILDLLTGNLNTKRTL